MLDISIERGGGCELALIAWPKQFSEAAVRIFSSALAASLLTLSTLTMPATALPGEAAGTVGCDPIALIQLSKTYGTIQHFGAECDHSLNVTVKARVFRNGVRVKSGSVRCTDTNQGEICESYLLVGNPKGKQLFKLAVDVYWDFDDQDDEQVLYRTQQTLKA